MESVLTAASSPTGRVTFSRVFGQQCQLMEAGRMWPESGKQNLLAVEVCQCVRVCLISFSMLFWVRLTCAVIADNGYFK